MKLSQIAVAFVALPLMLAAQQAPPNPVTAVMKQRTMLMGHIIDMADHYSQLSSYMRLNNILPPSALRPPGGD